MTSGLSLEMAFPYDLDLLQHLVANADSIYVEANHAQIADIHAYAKQIMQATHFAVLVATSGYKSLKLALGTTLEPSLGEYFATELAQRDEAARYGFVSQEHLWRGEAPHNEAAHLSVAGYVRVPIRLENRAIGVLVLGTQEVASWQANNLYAVQMLADSVGRLIENIFLKYNHLNIQRLQQTTFQIAQLSLETQDVYTVMNQVAEKAVALVGASGAEILVMEAGQLRSVAGKSVSRLQHQQESIELGEGLMGYVALKKIPQCVAHYASYDHALDGARAASDIASAMAVPLMAKDDLVGVMGLFRLVADGYLPFRQADLEVLEVLAPIAASVIDRATLRDAIRRERSQLQAILDNIPLPVMLFNRQGRLEMVNPVAHNVGRRFGMSLLTSLGIGLKELLAQLPPSATQIPKEFRTQQRYEFDFGVGGEFILQTAEAISLDGTTSGYVAVFQEVTEERRLSRARSELLYILSHDLGNILSLALGYTSLIMDDIAEEDEVDLFIGRIFESLERARALIRDVVEIEYAETNGLQVANNYDLAELLGKVITEQEGGANVKQQTLEFDIATTPPQQLIGNIPLIKQVFDNLISNAIKYTPKGGRVTVTLDCDAAAATVSVTDTGFGIPEAELVKIWDRFYRVRGTEAEDIDGTGLGLSLVKSVVETHGGTVTVESEYGKGSTFRVSLPFVLPDDLINT